MKKSLWSVLAVMALPMMTGCAQLGYYTQAVQGHFTLLATAKPIDQWLAYPGVTDDLKTRLKRAREIRALGGDEALLPRQAVH